MGGNIVGREPREDAAASLSRWGEVVAPWASSAADETQA